MHGRPGTPHALDMVAAARGRPASARHHVRRCLPRAGSAQRAARNLNDTVAGHVPVTVGVGVAVGVDVFVGVGVGVANCGICCVTQSA